MQRLQIMRTSTGKADATHKQQMPSEDRDPKQFQGQLGKEEERGGLFDPSQACGPAGCRENFCRNSLTPPPPFLTMAVSATDNPTLMPLAHYGFGRKGSQADKHVPPAFFRRLSKVNDCSGSEGRLPCPKRMKCCNPPRPGPALEGSASGSRGQIVKVIKCRAATPICGFL